MLRGILFFSFLFFSFLFFSFLFSLSFKGGVKEGDRYTQVGEITVYFPFDEETVRGWSEARLQAWRQRHTNANAYYYRFSGKTRTVGEREGRLTFSFGVVIFSSDPVVKQSLRTKSAVEKQANHEAFMARYRHELFSLCSSLLMCSSFLAQH